MPNTSENRFVVPLIAGCAVFMVIFAVCWGQQQRELMNDGIYKLGFYGFMGLFVGSAIMAEIRRDWGNAWRIVCLAIGVLFCVWCGAWKSDRAAKEDEGIQYNYPAK